MSQKKEEVTPNHADFIVVLKSRYGDPKIGIAFKGAAAAEKFAAALSQAMLAGELLHGREEYVDGNYQNMWYKARIDERVGIHIEKDRMIMQKEG